MTSLSKVLTKGNLPFEGSLFGFLYLRSFKTGLVASSFFFWGGGGGVRVGFGVLGPGVSDPPGGS